MSKEDDELERKAFEAREKERIAERLTGSESVPIFSGFMMAAMASGKSAKGAAGEADLAMAELRKRFT